VKERPESREETPIEGPHQSDAIALLQCVNSDPLKKFILIVNYGSK